MRAKYDSGAAVAYAKKWALGRNPAFGDFTALGTAFYMFAFREPHCPPGVADLLLHHIALEGSRQGQRLLNLGLGINAGVTFFKKKWGARELFPLITTSWQLPPKHWWKRLLS